MANSTYFKYPSVRFFSQMPIHHGGHSSNPSKSNNKNGYFGLTNLNHTANRQNIMYPTSSSQQTFYRDTPIESIPTTDESTPIIVTNNNNHGNINQGPIDNISSEGLIPPMNIGNEIRTQNSKSFQTGSSGQQQQTVRFTDNWM